MYTILGDSSPLSNPVEEKKETRMFYVADVITLSVVLELMRKSNLLVCYKLNIFRPPWVNQFDICALLFGGYARFIPLYKMVFMVIGKSFLLSVL